jgi:predicted DNA-binding antitoxin AbrB/MazE fold protein
MSELHVEAVYENGALRLAEPLPLAEGERVQIVVQVTTSRARQSAGLLRWTGAPEELHRFALDPELDVEESP